MSFEAFTADEIPGVGMPFYIQVSLPHTGRGMTRIEGYLLIRTGPKTAILRTAPVVNLPLAPNTDDFQHHMPLPEGFLKEDPKRQAQLEFRHFQESLADGTPAKFIAAVDVEFKAIKLEKLARILISGAGRDELERVRTTTRSDELRLELLNLLHVHKGFSPNTDAAYPELDEQSGGLT
ncbi:MAG: hypothetical protein JWN70_205 [Planctomycetaceae bacterium]|nr:hypothetical protein [Planctomycetaceae bacterium]